MRRLRQQDDRGVTTLFVVLVMPFLLLFGALVFDGGRGIVARRQTQNAADAGALAKATDCAKGIATTNFTPYETNGAVLEHTPTCGSGTTTVSMTKEINLMVLPGGGVRDVARSATARWGAINSAKTAPVVISRCSFDTATASGFDSTDVTIRLGGGGDACPGKPPGGFGWLDNDGNADGDADLCDVTTTLNAQGRLVVHGNTGTGNNNPWACITDVGVGGTILLPVYEASCGAVSPCAAGQNDGNGDNNYYLIAGFAEIRLLGWDLQHGSPRRAGQTPTGCGGSTSCLVGRVIQFTTHNASPGPGTDFGAIAVALSS